MKRPILATLAIILGVALCWAAPPVDKLPSLLTTPAEARNISVIVGGSSSGGSSCNSSANEVGNRNQEATAETFNAGYGWMFRTTADCTGNLDTGYIYSGNTDAFLAKVCVYTSSDTTPQSGDALVGCTTEISGGSPLGLKSAAAAGTYAVTNANNYWIVGFIRNPGAGLDLSGVRTNTVSMYYKACDETCYGTIPSTLGTGWSELGSSAPYTIYFTIE